MSLGEKKAEVWAAKRTQATRGINQKKKGKSGNWRLSILAFYDLHIWNAAPSQPPTPGYDCSQGGEPTSTAVSR